MILICDDRVASTETLPAPTLESTQSSFLQVKRRSDPSRSPAKGSEDGGDAG